MVQYNPLTRAASCRAQGAPMVRIRGVKFQENLKNDMGLEF